MFGHALIVGIFLVSYGGVDIDFMRLKSNYFDVGFGLGWQDTTAHLYPGRTIAFLRLNHNFKKIGISGGLSYNHMAYPGKNMNGPGDQFWWLYFHYNINKLTLGWGVWYHNWTYWEKGPHHRSDLFGHPEIARGDYYSHGELSAAWIDTFEVGKSGKIAFSISGGLGASPVPHEWKDKLTGFLAASFSPANSGNRVPIGLKVSLYRPPSAGAVLGIEVPLRWKYRGITAGTRLENGVKPSFYVYGYTTIYIPISKVIKTTQTSSSGGKPFPNEQRTNETVSVTVVIENEAGWNFIPPFALVDTAYTSRNDTLWEYDHAVFQNSIGTTIIKPLKVQKKDIENVGNEKQGSEERAGYNRESPVNTIPQPGKLTKIVRQTNKVPNDASSSNKISIAEITKNWKLQGIGYYGYRVDSIICDTTNNTLKFIIRPVWSDAELKVKPSKLCK